VASEVYKYYEEKFVYKKLDLMDEITEEIFKHFDDCVDFIY